MADSPDRQALLQHDQQFFDALVTADVSALDALLAEDFLLVSVDNGAVVTKEFLLGAIASGAVRFPAVKAFPDEAVTRRRGEVGVIVGRTEMNFTDAKGNAFTSGSRYTHVFAAQLEGGWHLLSAQGTPTAAD